MADASQRVVLVRHGATEWSESGQHTGLTDIDLTDVGRRQAEALAARLDGIEPALVLTSPLRRATGTAAAAGFADAERTDDALEWDYGDYEGITTEDIRDRREGWTIWTGGAPGGETADEVAARADRLIQRMRSAEGDVVLFSHGHFLRVLAACWLGLPGTEGRLLKLDTATISVLGWDREQPAIVRWNVPAEGC
jgi:probable phosphoglycerate mutase